MLCDFTQDKTHFIKKNAPYVIIKTNFTQNMHLYYNIYVLSIILL
jgi:hypothetical protein